MMKRLRARVEPSAKPKSKLKQLREAVRDESKVSIGTLSRPLAVNTYRHRHSSDSEEGNSMSGFVAELSEESDRIKGFGQPMHQPVHSGRTIKVIDVPGSRRIATKIRVPGQAAPSTKPSDLKRLHRFILELDYNGLDDATIEKAGVKPVPSSFESSSHYIEIFEPLLRLECAANILSAKQEASEEARFAARISSLSQLDHFHELVFEATLDKSLNSSAPCSDLDLLLLAAPDTEGSSILGIVIQSFARQDSIEFVVRVKFSSSHAPMQLQAREGLSWSCLRLCNLVTISREFAALQSVSRNPLVQAILYPSLQPIGRNKISTGTLVHRFGLNEPQSKAVAYALSCQEPFVLVQGPPGTGKTKTIEALLGAALGGLAHESFGQVLLCAPSNAAIDELVSRIKDGIQSFHGARIPVRVVRIGSSDVVHDKVREVTLDSILEKRLSQQPAESRRHEQLREQIGRLREELDRAEHNVDSIQRLSELRAKLWSAKDESRKLHKTSEEARNAVRANILREAQIICCTLSGSGHDILAKIGCVFKTVIVDEACQCVELSSLIPMQYGCQKCILVGDPNQLPPTVLSQAATQLSYEQSLFQRIQRSCPKSVLLLSLQYRMHPEISRFPCEYFYNGQLANDPGVAAKTRRPWHEKFGPYLFFDVHGSHATQRLPSGRHGHSLMNDLEVQAAVALVSQLCLSAPSLNVLARSQSPS